jgi:hypothetical protein
MENKFKFVLTVIACNIVVTSLIVMVVWNMRITNSESMNETYGRGQRRVQEECCSCQKEIWIPSPKTTWQWQISGAINTSFDVDMYDIDLFDAKIEVIDKLHTDGRKVICYFSAGTFENWRPDKDKFPASVLGSPLEEWPGERWLDIAKLDIIGPIMQARLDLAVEKGCDGVEPDNVDGYKNANGVGLDASKQLSYNKWLAREAHLRGLSIGLKNDLDQVLQLVDHFDFAINEQCWQFKECSLLRPFINAGKAVFGVEYSGTPRQFCPKLNAMGFSWLKKRLSLDAFRIDCMSI